MMIFFVVLFITFSVDWLPFLYKVKSSREDGDNALVFWERFVKKKIGEIVYQIDFEK